MFWKWLLAILFWWFRKAPPSPVKKFKVKVKHMTNVNLSWKDPTTREDGSALDATEIAGIELSMSTGGAPPTKFTTVAAGVQTFTVVDLAPGTYDFSADVVDTQVPPKVSAEAAQRRRNLVMRKIPQG